MLLSSQTSRFSLREILLFFFYCFIFLLSFFKSANSSVLCHVCSGRKSMVVLEFSSFWSVHPTGHQNEQWDSSVRADDVT